MLNSILLLIIIFAYLIGLFLVALFFEKNETIGKKLANNNFVFALAVAIYCTSWTYYGNVGFAAADSYLYLAVYIGPTLIFLFWNNILIKMARIKRKYGLASIADFISLRYNKSYGVAAIATLIAVIGIMPYIALQLKAMFSTFITISNYYGGYASEIFLNIAVIIFLIIFIIIFGFRKLDLSNQHPGLVITIALQSIIKLLAFLTAGLFVSYFMFDGFGDIFQKFSAASQAHDFQIEAPSFSLWMAYLILSMSAIMFLPRQFHMTVVENTSDKQIKTAAWLLPVYFFLITLFVIPIALAGLLKGYPAEVADFFILLLPLDFGNNSLATFIFLGGFSAGLSMILVSTISMTTMVSNHLILPVIEKIKYFNFLNRFILIIRWAIVAIIILVGYWFEKKIGNSYVLVKIGMISFAAALQFVPALVGGLYWKKGNKIGAVWGLSTGFFLWIYTALVPAFVRSGWISYSFLESGPAGIGFLKPENLFGITNMNPLMHTILYTMLFNIGSYIIFSLWFGQNQEEKRIADSFINIKNDEDQSIEVYSGSKKVNCTLKAKALLNIFENYFKENEASNLVSSCLTDSEINPDQNYKISVRELIKLKNYSERLLANYIGQIAAKNAFARNNFLTEAESNELMRINEELIAELNLTPEELNRKIDYYKLKEKDMERQSQKLESMVKQRTGELMRKTKDLEASKQSLEAKVNSLERLQKLTVDRELRMIELKQQLKNKKNNFK